MTLFLLGIANGTYQGHLPSMYRVPTRSVQGCFDSLGCAGDGLTCPKVQSAWAGELLASCKKMVQAFPPLAPATGMMWACSCCGNGVMPRSRQKVSLEYRLLVFVGLLSCRPGDQSSIIWERMSGVSSSGSVRACCLCGCCRDDRGSWASLAV